MPVPDHLVKEANEAADLRVALDAIANWWSREMIANEVTVTDWKPPAALLDRLVANMVCFPFLGWPDEESARGYLEEELFPALSGTKEG